MAEEYVEGEVKLSMEFRPGVEDMVSKAISGRETA